MRMNTKRGAVTLVSVAMVLAASGCSTKSSDSATSTQGGVKVGRGISGNTITLGSLTDLTGVFAALGKDITNAQALYWKNQKPTRSAASTRSSPRSRTTATTPRRASSSTARSTTTCWRSSRPSGPRSTPALLPQFDADHMVNIPAAWAQSLTEDKQIAVVGATYEVEMINVLDYLLKEGKIKKGDKIGHIYFEGEYGDGGLNGSKYFAKKNGLKVVEQQIQPTDTDMTAQVTKLKSEGVKAIALTVAPGQTASVAGAAASMGLDVPIAGNNPVFAPALLDGPAGPALKKNLYVASPVAPFDKLPDLLKSYTGAYKGDPTLGVVWGTAAADTMRQILDKACADKDLTPEGVSKAKDEMGTVDTGGLAVPLTFKTGESPSDASYIFRAADVPGGAKSVSDKFVGDDVASFMSGS